MHASGRMTMNKKAKYNVAIVGATGLVGSTFLKVLSEYQFPINNLKLYASSRSAGKEIIYNGQPYYVEDLQQATFEGIDIALFSAGAGISKEYGVLAEKAGAYVIDNSSAFRMDLDKALIVPEINPDDYKGKSKIIANPNCSTIQVVLPLKALDAAFGLKRVVYTTYQAVSGSGQKGINDLQGTLKGEKPAFYPYDISKTCIPQIDSFLDNHYTNEEIKMVNETRKILHQPNLLVSATCVRVPVANSHAVAVMCDLDKSCTLEEVFEVLRKAPGVILIDDIKKSLYPLSTIATGTDQVYVGRIRKDLSSENGILFYTTCDNIRKGAASNAVQIAEYLIGGNTHDNSN